MEDEENQGSMLLGVLLGFFLGCIGIIIAFVLRGQKTLTGSIIGTVIAFLLWSCLSVGLFALQMLLMNA
jgi:hypothetical protein